MPHADDWVEMRSCIRLTKEIFAQEAVAANRDPELAPDGNFLDETALDQFFKEKVESAYHPCDTCRMGADAGAAEDLNAPTLMLGEPATDLIRGRSLAAATVAPLLAAAEWETQQRSRAIIEISQRIVCHCAAHSKRT